MPIYRRKRKLIDGFFIISYFENCLKLHITTVGSKYMGRAILLRNFLNEGFENAFNIYF
jgi:hypothetical protein